MAVHSRQYGASAHFTALALITAIASLGVTACGEPSPGDAGTDGRADAGPRDGATDSASALRQCLARLGRDAGMDAISDVPGVDAQGTDASFGIDATDAVEAGVTPVQLALGDQFSCVRLSDGRVSCWGANQDGQMADGTNTSRLTPVPVTSVAGAVQLATGGRHACVIGADGAMRCWGRDVEGQIGDGMPTAISPIATIVPCMTDIPQMALGGGHSCARMMLGTLACWGANAFGQVGDGAVFDRSLPTEVATVTGAIDVAAGDTHTCARMSNGTVQCWGDDTFGQLGIGASRMSVPLPSTVPGLANVDEIALGGFHSCARLRNGTVQCWGHNNAGQLGDGTTVDQWLPVEVSGLRDVVQLALGAAHTCARRMDGSVWCWGWNLSGQLGDAVASVRMTPAAVPGVANAVQVATGGQHTCALLVDHSVLCWGNNQRGQIGDGTHTLRTAATVIRVGG